MENSSYITLAILVIAGAYKAISLSIKANAFRKAFFERINLLASNMESHIAKDEERMTLLNQAIVKLALEAQGSRESADAIRNVVQAGDSGGDTLMDAYHQAVKELKQQGYSDANAHKMAADSVLGKDF